MQRLILTCCSLSLLAVAGCDSQQSIDSRELDNVQSPISPKLAILDKTAIDKLATAERDKLAQVQAQLDDELQKQTDCAQALERLHRLSAKRDALVTKLRSLGTTHAELLGGLQTYSRALSAWARSFSAAVGERKPDWDSITDMAAYERAQTRIDGLVSDATPTRELINQHRAVDAQLGMQLVTVADVITELNTVAELSNRCVNLTTVFSDAQRWGNNLQGQLRTLAKAYSSTRAALAAVDTKRQTAAPVVQAAWHRLLRVSLYNVYLTQANGILSATFNALNDAPTYYEVGRKVDQAFAEVKELFYRRHSPHLARRALRITGVLLDDVERNLPTLPITEVNRADLRNKIAGTRNTLTAMFRRVDGLTERDHTLFATRRQQLAASALATSNATPTTHCQALAASSAAPGLEGEQSYAELQRDCLAGGGQ